jgi:hypothetical protein
MLNKTISKNMTEHNDDKLLYGGLTKEEIEEGMKLMQEAEKEQYNGLTKEEYNLMVQEVIDENTPLVCSIEDEICDLPLDCIELAEQQYGIKIQVVHNEEEDELLIKEVEIKNNKNGDIRTEHIEKWIINLWEWADENNLPEKIFPRDKEILLSTKRLSFYGYEINRIPKEIGYLVNLEKLYLAKQGLKSIPKEIGNLMNLQFLWIHTNNLSELPEEIENLPFLRHLKAEGNPNLTLSENQKQWLDILKKRGKDEWVRV